MPPHDEPSPKAYSNSSKREEASEARSRSMRRSGRGRRRATADGLGDAVVSLGAVSRGYLDMVMTSPPRRLEVRSRLVVRFHVCELLHIRFSPSDGLILFVSISELDGPEAFLSCLRVRKLTLIQRSNHWTGKTTSLLKP